VYELIKNVHVKLAAYSSFTLLMDVVVIIVLDALGMLSRKWAANLGGNI
jgi:hypothetical protein